MKICVDHNKAVLIDFFLEMLQRFGFVHFIKCQLCSEVRDEMNISDCIITYKIPVQIGWYLVVCFCLHGG